MVRPLPPRNSYACRSLTLIRVRLSSLLFSQTLGFTYEESELFNKFGLRLESPANLAQPLIDDVCLHYSDQLDGCEEGASRGLLAAYARMAAKEEAFLLAEQLHSQSYQKNTIVRGRLQFLSFLHTIQHKSMDQRTPESVLELYRDPSKNMAEICNLLSMITPITAEEYLAMYTSKDQEARSKIIGVGSGRQVKVCVGHSAACSARASAASLWRAVDQINKWAPMPSDPERGTGCPFYSTRVTRCLMNKQKLDLREGRGKTSALLIYLEDFTEYYRTCAQRLMDASDVLDGALRTAADNVAEQRIAWSTWSRKLMLSSLTQFCTTAQREGGQRAEITNLTVAEVQVGFNAVEELPTITKKRQGGTTKSETCRMRHWGCGPFCHKSYVTSADVSPPSVQELRNRSEQYLQLPPQQQGICGACSFSLLESVLNVAWHAQQASEVQPAAWHSTHRHANLTHEQRSSYFFLPSIKFGDAAKKTQMTLDSQVTLVFSPARSKDARANDAASTYAKLLMQAAWPNGMRTTQFGLVPVSFADVTSHGIKKGALVDLGASKASPALVLAHGHHENFSTAAQYQVWELEHTDQARNLLCQPRIAAAGESASHIEVLREMIAMRAEFRTELQGLREDQAAKDQQIQAHIFAIVGTCTQLATALATVVSSRNGGAADALGVNAALGSMAMLASQVNNLASTGSSAATKSVVGPSGSSAATTSAAGPSAMPAPPMKPPLQPFQNGGKCAMRPPSMPPPPMPARVPTVGAVPWTTGAAVPGWTEPELQMMREAAEGAQEMLHDDEAPVVVLQGKELKDATDLAATKAARKRELRQTQEEEKCPVEHCSKMLKKDALSAHKLRCIQSADPCRRCPQGSAAHVDATGWQFLVGYDDGVRYCARNMKATGSNGRGCRRPFGSGPRFCNTAKQQMSCSPLTGCVCGTDAQEPERRFCMACKCPDATNE